jgi:hypothetical protein
MTRVENTGGERKKELEIEPDIWVRSRLRLRIAVSRKLS